MELLRAAEGERGLVPLRTQSTKWSCPSKLDVMECWHGTSGRGRSPRHLTSRPALLLVREGANVLICHFWRRGIHCGLSLVAASKIGVLYTLAPGVHGSAVCCIPLIRSTSGGHFHTCPWTPFTSALFVPTTAQHNIRTRQA